jgi:hypothetical protein
MIRILTLIALAATAVISSSCCCTSDTKAPKLKKLPKFRDFPAAPVESAPAPVVDYQK